MPLDIFYDNRLLLIAAAIVILVVMLAIFFVMKRVIKKHKSSVATTAFIQKSILKQMLTSKGGEQMELRAAEYDMDNTIEEIKQNMHKISIQKNEIIELVEILKQEILQEESKQQIIQEPKQQLNEINIMIEEIKLKLIELQAKTNNFCSDANVKRFTQEIPKINAAPRIMSAKDKGLVSAIMIAEIVKSTELDKKYYQNLLKIVKALPKEIKSFVAFIETQLKAIERKLDTFLSKLFKISGKESILSHKKTDHVSTHKKDESIKPLLDTLHKIIKQRQNGLASHPTTKKISDHSHTEDKIEPPRFKK